MGLRNPRFRRLEYLYLIALGCIALSIIISQVLIQRAIEKQEDDARVINVAGRQRMLSQKISKVALQLKLDTADHDAKRQELSEAVDLWVRSHRGLLAGDSLQGLSGKNSPRIIEMFAVIDTPFQEMSKQAAVLLDSTHSVFSRDIALATILANEGRFLDGMNEIVFQYDAEAQSKLRQLETTEYSLFLISILIIVLELLFVFRPLARNIRRNLQELEKSEDSFKEAAGELSHLYEELGKSYQDLEAVNIAADSYSVFMKLDSRGAVQYISPDFLKLMEYEELSPPVDLRSLLITSGYSADFVDGLMKLLNQRSNWSGELRLVTEPGDFIWLDTFIVPVAIAGQIKIIARDITEIKEAKIRSREINKERIEKSVKEQHFRSSLILQGQEEERKRLSQELHDGVGQMMSAMKLLLESISPSSKIMKSRMVDARSLMKSIIQEVRRVSFNLTPSSLNDFGLVPAISKFCEEIDGVAKAKVSFVNETSFFNRLENTVETNLYRIIQEAVNNAIKYAKAKSIEVRFTHNVNSLQITIIDDGKGFNLDRLERSGHFENAGHGIFNMRERAAYIGGTFRIETNLNSGTQVFINLSLDKND